MKTETSLESAALSRAWLQRAQRAEVQVLGLRAFLDDLKTDIEIMRTSPPTEIEQMEFLDGIPDRIDKLLAGDASAAENEEKSA
jgi:hypothetical protein